MFPSKYHKIRRWKRVVAGILNALMGEEERKSFVGATTSFAGVCCKKKAGKKIGAKSSCQDFVHTRTFPKL